MPMMAASTPLMSFTCGSRMKLPIPVKRGAFMASTGRYLGTGEFGLDSLHALFVDDADHLVAEIAEGGCLQGVKAARPRYVNRHRGADATRPARHHVNHVAEEDRLLDVVGHEQNGLAIALPEIGEQLLHDL